MEAFFVITSEMHFVKEQIFLCICAAGDAELIGQVHALSMMDGVMINIG